MKLELTIQIEGETESDLEYALEEVTRLVREGYSHGFNSNDTGSFNFDIAEPPQ